MSQHSDQGGATSPPAATTAAAGILTVAGILVLFVIFAFGIASLHYCLDYMDRRTRSRGVGAQPSPSGRRRRRGAAVRSGGVDPELLRSLPVVTVCRAKKDENEGSSSSVVEEECAVCLAEIEDGEEARFLPRCGHGFHAECVDAWLATHTTCPLCRLTVAKPDVAPPPLPAAALLALHPVPRESANYRHASGNNLPAAIVPLGVSDHHPGAVTAAAAPSADRVFATATLVTDIPAESAAPTACDAAKSPGSASARLRSIRRLWSFGRQGAGSGSSSCSCAGSSERADVEQGIGAFAVTEASEAAASIATRGAAV